jgi:hypothetical protein
LPMGNQRPDANNRVVDVLGELVAHFGANFVIALAKVTVRSGVARQIRDGFDIPNDYVAQATPSTVGPFKSTITLHWALCTMTNRCKVGPVRIPRKQCRPMCRWFLRRRYDYLPMPLFVSIDPLIKSDGMRGVAEWSSRSEGDITLKVAGQLWRFRSTQSRSVKHP